MALAGSRDWASPPSKSHLIRWLALAGQGRSECLLRFEGEAGADAESMARCLEAMGVRVHRGSDGWLVEPPAEGLAAPSDVLDCGNSGTSARVLTAMAATMGEAVRLDGDESLRARSSELARVLRELGVKVSGDALPTTVNGSMRGGANVDLSTSSQPLSALILASPGLPEAVEIHLEGEGVSRGYTGMTFDVARRCGCPIEMGSPLILQPWQVQAPEEVDIPPELSLFPMAILLEILHEDLQLRTSLPAYDPLMLMAIDAIDRAAGGEVDLRDASDLVTPAAVWMALSGGGTISGIPHARGKESDRIARTIELLAAFGMLAEETEDGLTIPGEQSLQRPDSPVETHLDHRLAMTAMILASKVGADIVGAEICDVTHPGFIEQLLGLAQP